MDTRRRVEASRTRRRANGRSLSLLASVPSQGGAGRPLPEAPYQRDVRSSRPTSRNGRAGESQHAPSRYGLLRGARPAPRSAPPSSTTTQALRRPCSGQLRRSPARSSLRTAPQSGHARRATRGSVQGTIPGGAGPWPPFFLECHPPRARTPDLGNSRGAKTPQNGPQGPLEPLQARRIRLPVPGAKGRSGGACCRHAALR